MFYVFNSMYKLLLAIRHTAFSISLTLRKTEIGTYVYPTLEICFVLLYNIKINTQITDLHHTNSRVKLKLICKLFYLLLNCLKAI